MAQTQQRLLLNDRSSYEMNKKKTNRHLQFTESRERISSAASGALIVSKVNPPPLRISPKHILNGLYAHNRVGGVFSPSHTTERAFYGTPRFQLFGNANGIKPRFLNHSFPMALLACANCDFCHHPLRHIAVSHAWCSVHPFCIRNLAIPMRLLHCFKR